MTTLTPGDAILIRNIVIAIALFLVWGVGILVAYNLAGTYGSVLAFFFGPLGVLAAFAMHSDPSNPPSAKRDPVEEALAAARSGDMSAGQVVANLVAQEPLAQTTPQLNEQTELLKRIVIYQSEQIRLLRNINRVAQYFFWVSIIGAVITLCIIPYLNSLY